MLYSVYSKQKPLTLITFIKFFILLKNKHDTKTSAACRYLVNGKKRVQNINKKKLQLIVTVQCAVNDMAVGKSIPKISLKTGFSERMETRFYINNKYVL